MLEIKYIGRKFILWYRFYYTDQVIYVRILLYVFSVLHIVMCLLLPVRYSIQHFQNFLKVSSFCTLIFMPPQQLPFRVCLKGLQCYLYSCLCISRIVSTGLLFCLSIAPQCIVSFFLVCRFLSNPITHKLCLIHSHRKESVVLPTTIPLVLLNVLITQPISN